METTALGPTISQSVFGDPVYLCNCIKKSGNLLGFAKNISIWSEKSG